MATSFAGIKQKLDLPSWQPTNLIYSQAGAIQPGAAGSTLADDKRASQYKRNNIYFLNSSSTFFKYNTIQNGWLPLASPALVGTFGIGAISVFMPSAGPRGAIASGATTTTLTLSTALPATVGANQLVGQRIRVIGNTAGGSGKIEIKVITANTAGTTPLITLDSALTFTPALNATYEILAGRVFLMSASTVAAGIWKSFDESTTSYSGNLATTNLPATVGTGSAIVGMDELYTPITGPSGVAINGEEGGYYGLLTATASAAGTLTGHATGGDSGVVINQWRNFQIRIIEDTTTPTAVGQRRKITSHTAGASPVYTLASSWTVTPSANAKYYIENNNDILFWTGTNTATYSYDWVGNTWSNTAYAAQPAANAAGTIAFQAFGSTRAPGVIYKFRGGATSTLDIFDITAAATGTWTAAVPYDNQGAATFNTSAGHAYSVLDNKALITPVSIANVPVQMYTFEPDAMSMKPYSQCQQVSSTVADGDRVAIDIFVDGTDKKAMFYLLPCSQSYMLRSLFFV